MGVQEEISSLIGGFVLWISASGILRCVLFFGFVQQGGDCWNWCFKSLLLDSDICYELLHLVMGPHSVSVASMSPYQCVSVFGTPFISLMLLECTSPSEDLLWSASHRAPHVVSFYGEDIAHWSLRIIRASPVFFGISIFSFLCLIGRWSGRWTVRSHRPDTPFPCCTMVRPIHRPMDRFLHRPTNQSSSVRILRTIERTMDRPLSSSAHAAVGFQTQFWLEFRFRKADIRNLSDDSRLLISVSMAGIA